MTKEKSVPVNILVATDRLFPLPDHLFSETTIS
jgi:hypothetical protein